MMGGGQAEARGGARRRGERGGELRGAHPTRPPAGRPPPRRPPASPPSRRGAARLRAPPPPTHRMLPFSLIKMNDNLARDSRKEWRRGGRTEKARLARRGRRRGRSSSSS